MTTKRILGITLIVLFVIAFTVGFAFLGVIYGGYSFGISLLFPLGAYVATAVIGALVWLIVYLFNS